jgi:hypothetical protein
MLGPSGRDVSDWLSSTWPNIVAAFHFASISILVGDQTYQVGEMAMMERYKQHVIDQAVTI